MASFTAGRVIAVLAGLSAPLVGAMLAVSVARGHDPASPFDDGLRSDADLAPSAVPAIVVAELFTSEGCSSCPPADEVLSRLIREQPIHGVQVIALGEHVDYWDRLGWRDSFSSPVFTSRQSEYQERVFHGGSIYTPQFVVDGQIEGVGSDTVAIRRAIVRAAHASKATIGVSWSAIDADHVQATLQVDVPPELTLRGQADLTIAVTQNRLTSDVDRGENRGRHLKHNAVVRSLTACCSLHATARTFSTTISLPVAAEWERSDIQIVAFLQERESRRIVGAGASSIERHEGTW